MNSNLYFRNRQKLLASLENNSLLIIDSAKAPFMSADASYQYHFNRNLYYFTGIKQESSALVIVKKNDQLESHLFLTINDELKARWYGKTISLEEASDISQIAKDKIHTYDKLHGFCEQFISFRNFKIVYLPFAPLQKDYSSELELSAKLTKAYPFITIKNATPLITDLRMIKEEEEIAMIKQAIAMTNDGIKAIIKKMNKNSYEYQLASEFNYALQHNSTTAFPSIIASGENSLCLHHIDLNKQLGEDNILLLDLGASYQGYSADISRTIPISGRFSETEKKIYNIVLDMQKAAIEKIKPDVKWLDVEQAAKDIGTKKLLELGLLGKEEEIGKYFWHSIGHSLGLDTHDLSPIRSEIILKPGMVLTVEPGLYFPELKFGVRIEDDILVTESGYQNLSKDIIKDVDGLEKLIKEIKK